MYKFYYSKDEKKAKTKRWDIIAFFIRNLKQPEHITFRKKTSF